MEHLWKQKNITVKKFHSLHNGTIYENKRVFFLHFCQMYAVLDLFQCGLDIGSSIINEENIAIFTTI